MKLLWLVAAIVVASTQWCCNEKPRHSQDESVSDTPTERLTSKTSPTSPTLAPEDEARTLFEQRCVACHGSTGNGDGPASKSLDPKPRAFADPAFQKSVTDEHLAKVIVEGGTAVGLSASMPGNPDLKEKDEVVQELIKIIRK